MQILLLFRKPIIFVSLMLAMQACSSGSSGGTVIPDGGGNSGGGGSGEGQPADPAWSAPVMLFDRHGRIAAGDQLYALGQNGGLTDFVSIRSTDQGANWSDVLATVTGASNQNVYRGFFVEGDVLHLVARDPSNNHLYYHRSNNGGESWQNRVQISMLPEDALSFRRYSLASASGVLHLMDVGGAPELGIRYFRSEDGGQNWSRQRIKPGVSIGVESWEIPTLLADGDTIHLSWSGADSSGPNQVFYARSDDRGLTFARVARISDGTKLSWRQDMTVIGGVVIYVWGERAYDINDEDDFFVRRSLDGGATWEPQKLVAEAPAGRRYGPHPEITSGPGDRVHVAYIDDPVSGDKSTARAVYQLSEDRGATWGPIEEVASIADDGVGQVFEIAATADYVHVLIGEQGSGDGPQPSMYARRPLQ